MMMISKKRWQRLAGILTEQQEDWEEYNDREEADWADQSLSEANALFKKIVASAQAGTELAMCTGVRIDENLIKEIKRFLGEL